VILILLADSVCLKLQFSLCRTVDSATNRIDLRIVVLPVTVGTVQEPLTIVTALDAGALRFVSAA
jgi:hypothetical protein